MKLWSVLSHILFYLIGIWSNTQGFFFFFWTATIAWETEYQLSV